MNAEKITEDHVAYHGRFALYNAESSHARGYRVQFRLRSEDDYKVFKGMTKRKKGRAGIVFRVSLLGELPRMIEAYFAGWSVTNSDGARVTFDLQTSEDFDFFRELPALCDTTEGIEWEAVMVEVGDDGQAVDQKRREQVESMKGGVQCKRAALLCTDRNFRLWCGTQKMTLGRAATQDEAAQMIRDVCRIASRAELDHDDSAAERFRRWITLPYAKWAENL